MRIVFLLLIITSGIQVKADTLQRIAFGSCSHQDKPQPIWTEVLKSEPELFIFLGDNIYGDSDDPEILAEKYERLQQHEGFAQLRATTDVIATWDDHDYGRNDAGKEYESKFASRELMLDFWDEPEDSERRRRDSGIYTSYLYGDPGQRVQIILLDLRWNRTELVAVTDPIRQANRVDQNRGPYEATFDVDAELLGEEQWLWLDQQLQVEADLRFIGSSIQLLAEFTGWETWANYPNDRLRFINMIAKHQNEPIVILSGDVHWSELSRIDETASNWPLIEFTSSGLTEEWKAISPNRHRVGDAFAVANFGLIDIDWSTSLPTIDFVIRDVSGQDLIKQRISF